MTVITTSYSSLDEVWADSYLSPALQKKSKKKKPPPHSDPICDLYAQSTGNYANETDIISYANQFYEKHEKAKYQRPQMLSREKLPKVVEIDVQDDIPFVPNAGGLAPANRKIEYAEPIKSNDEVQHFSEPYEIYQNEENNGVEALENNSDDDFTQPSDSKEVHRRTKDTYDPPPMREKIHYNTREYYDDDDDVSEFAKKNTSFNYFDIILYIISGVILIFVMEQFVKIGVLLR